jgi:hypothetical protein
MAAVPSRGRIYLSPIAYGRRHEFMLAVAAAVEQAGGGVGLIYRVGREVQSKFVISAQRETSASAEPR